MCYPIAYLFFSLLSLLACNASAPVEHYGTTFSCCCQRKPGLRLPLSQQDATSPIDDTSISSSLSPQLRWTSQRNVALQAAVAQGMHATLPPCLGQLIVSFLALPSAFKVLKPAEKLELYTALLKADIAFLSPDKLVVMGLYSQPYGDEDRITAYYFAYQQSSRIGASGWCEKNAIPLNTGVSAGRLVKHANGRVDMFTPDTYYANLEWPQDARASIGPGCRQPFRSIGENLTFWGKEGLLAGVIVGNSRTYLLVLDESYNEVGKFTLSSAYVGAPDLVCTSYDKQKIYVLGKNKQDQLLVQAWGWWPNKKQFKHPKNYQLNLPGMVSGEEACRQEWQVQQLYWRTPTDALLLQNDGSVYGWTPGQPINTTHCVPAIWGPLRRRAVKSAYLPHKEILVLGAGQDIRLYDVPTLQLLATLQHSCGFYAIACSPDEKKIVALDYNYHLVGWGEYTDCP